MVNRQKPPPEAGDVAFARWLEEEHAEEFRARKEGRKSNGSTDYGADQEYDSEVLDTIDIGLTDDDDIPEQEYLDGHQFIMMDAVHTMTGDGGAGKTDVAVQLGIGCALDAGKFLNLPVRHGHVVFFSAEETAVNIRRRIRAICDAEMIDRAAIGGRLHIIDCSHRPAWLFEVNRDGRLIPTALWKRLKMTVAKYTPVAVIIDNRARVFAGNQNDTVLGVEVTIELDRLGSENHCAVILLGHVSLSQMSTKRGDSGSVAWANAGRSRSYLSLPEKDDEEGSNREDDGKRVLTLMKTSSSKPGKSVEFKWEMGRFRCLYQPVKADEGIGRDAKSVRVFKKFMEAYAVRDVRLSQDQSSHKSYAPSVFFNDRTISREGVSKSELTKAMWILWDQGWLTSQRKRFGSHYAECLVIAQNTT